MKVPEHVALSFLLTQIQVHQEFGGAGTALVIAAGCLPDMDGLGILAGWRFYRTYHRMLGHSLPVTLIGPLLLGILGAFGFGLGRLPVLWIWLQISLVAHLITDVCFYPWPVQLLWPVSSRGWGLGFLSWNDLVPTLTLYSGTALVFAWSARAPAVAILGLTLLFLYVGWRALRPRPESGWETWITGGWAANSARFWRWLTGDFVT